MKKVLTIVLLLLLSLSVQSFSQDNTSTNLFFSGEHKYSKAMVYLNDEATTLYETKSLVINDDVLTLQKPAPYAGATATQEQFSLSNIYLIKVSKGTKAAEYAIWGGLLGGLSGFLGAIQGVNDAENQALMEGKTVTNSDEIVRNITVGFTIAGVVIGGIYGASQHKWETIYNESNLSNFIPKNLKYSFAYSPNSKAMLLNMRVLF